MPTNRRGRRLDAAAWRTATLSSPFVVQAVLGLLLLLAWAMGKGYYTTESGRSERTWILTATTLTALATLTTSAALLRSQSARHRGLGLSAGACSIAVWIGGALYAYLVLR